MNYNRGSVVFIDTGDDYPISGRYGIVLKTVHHGYSYMVLVGDQQLEINNCWLTRAVAA